MPSIQRKRKPLKGFQHLKKKLACLEKEMNPTSSSGKTESEAIHDELVVRWSTYLRQSIPADSRKELNLKYPIPENCSTLRAPILNEEIKSILTPYNAENETFLNNIQELIGVGISAIGEILNLKLLKPEVNITFNDDLLQKLADAAQIFSNVHHAISLKRKFEVTPLINEDSKTAAQQSSIDEYLFGAESCQMMKSCQTMKKSAQEIKKLKKRSI